MSYSKEAALVQKKVVTVVSVTVHIHSTVIISI